MLRRLLRPAKLLLCVTLAASLLLLATISYITPVRNGWTPVDGYYAAWFNSLRARPDTLNLKGLPNRTKRNLNSLKSQWHCTSEDYDHYNASRLCFVKNMCINKVYGAFMVDHADKPAEGTKSFPWQAMTNVGQGEDAPWRLDTRPARDLEIDYLDEKIFVYGVYVPGHYAHWFYNGLMPVYAVMRDYGATDRSWMYRATTFDYTDYKVRFETDHVTKGYEIVQDESAVSGKSQILPPADILCFSEAIIGVGNYGVQDNHRPVTAAHFAEYARSVHEYYNTTDLERYIGTPEDEFDPMLDPTTTKVTHRASDKCFHNARVFNAGPGKMLVTLIQRPKRRHVENLQDLAAHLAKTYDYAVHLLTFDNGCSIGATAALLREAQVLITSHGSQLAAAVFMAPGTTVISLDGYHYSEPWFDGPMLSMGRRFFHWSCDAACLVQDENMIRELLPSTARLTNDDVTALARGISDDAMKLLVKAHPDVDLWRLDQVYRRDSPRRVVDIPKLGRFVASAAKDLVDERKSQGVAASALNKAKTNGASVSLDFVALCERKGCCGGCWDGGRKYLFGPRSAHPATSLGHNDGSQYKEWKWNG